MVPAIDRASAASASGDWAACLVALLAAWRVAKQPPLADLIERVSARVSSPPCPPRAAAITKRIAGASDLDVAAILEVVALQVRVSPGWSGYVGRIARDRPADPRVATALASFVRRSPRAGMDGALDESIVGPLDAIDDPRYRSLLVESWQRLEPNRGRIRKYRTGLDALKAIATTIERRAPPTAIAGLDAAIERIDADLSRAAAKQRSDSRNATELLDAIYDNPLDDALRLVYADALQQAGDPRGEFIALQCARGLGPASRRERSLLAANERPWLGAIEPLVLKQGTVYRRGFIACAREAVRKKIHRGLLAAREWRTIEELELAEWGAESVAFLADPKPALRRVWNVHSDDLRAVLAKSGTLGWTTLGLYLRWNTPAKLDLTTLPELRELDLTNTHSTTVTELHGSVIVGGVQRLRAACRRNLADFIRFAGEAGIPELELVEHGFRGEPAGEAVRIVGDRLTLVHHGMKLYAKYATRIVTQLAIGSITSVALEAPPGAKVDRPSWNQLGAALAAHGITAPEPEAVPRG